MLLSGNVSSLVAQSDQNGLPNRVSEDHDVAGGKRTNVKHSDQLDEMDKIPLPDIDDDTNDATRSIYKLRENEITGKAVSGILLVLMKWFKLSRKL